MRPRGGGIGGGGRPRGGAGRGQEEGVSEQTGGGGELFATQTQETIIQNHIQSPCRSSDQSRSHATPLQVDSLQGGNRQPGKRMHARGRGKVREDPGQGRRRGVGKLQGRASRRGFLDLSGSLRLLMIFYFWCETRGARACAILARCGCLALV